MADAAKLAERRRKAVELRQYTADLARAGYKPSAATVADCLEQARREEQQAASSRLAREVLAVEIPATPVPVELSDATIAQYHHRAAESYGYAAAACLRHGDLRRAYRYFRKASRHSARGKALGPSAPAAPDTPDTYGRRAALVRQEIARRSVCRRKLSLGLLGKLR